MVEEVISKLKVELELPFKSERQVVYILSRIRKILELEKSEAKYPHLSFYCDISLHSQIDRTSGELRQVILKEFIQDPASTHKFGFHTEFSTQLNNFFSAHGLTNISNSDLDDFIFELGKVISDTPIKVTLDKKNYKIVFKPPRNKDESGLRIISPPYNL